MKIGLLVRCSLVLVGCILVAWEVRRRKAGGSARFAPAHVALALVAVGSIALALFLYLTHLRYPLHLDLMEGTVWQHFQRAANFEAVYPEPSPEFVPLCYNPLTYVASIPFGWIFGVSLFSLRLLSVLACIGIGLILYARTFAVSRSHWWGLMAAGLFASAYRVMDAYLDTAHGDAGMIFCALLGSYLISRDRSRLVNVLGVVVLVAAFWFKQHGAVFTVGGVLFLTWREGLRRSSVYWVVAAILGPAVYFLLGPAIFGSHFLYFTWEVPAQWAQPDRAALERMVLFFLKRYPVLLLGALGLLLARLLRNRAKLNVFHFQVVVASLTAVVGVMDPGSSNNVFAPAGVFLIVVGVEGFYRASNRFRGRALRPGAVGLLITFALLLYDPRPLVLARADRQYGEMLTLLRGLDGPIYAPTLAQLDKDFAFRPAAHWVALEDMIRGPNLDTCRHPKTLRLLAAVVDPPGDAYVLAHRKLSTHPVLDFLEEQYSLEVDFGERFIALRGLPARFHHGWPRFLYKHQRTKSRQPFAQGR